MKTELGKAVRTCLQQLSNPARAKQQQAYMKSTTPHYGVMAAPLRANLKSVVKEHPCNTNEDWVLAAQDLWRNAAYREERYAAIELLATPAYQRAWFSTDHYPMLREMIVSGAWWDYVDNLAANHVFKLLKKHPRETTVLMRGWAREDDLWLRRTSIICQLKRRKDTDLELLTYAINGSIADSNFFARKAIGWALREYSKTDPDWVVGYIETNEERLSPLSQREGLKVIRKAQGALR